jgi:small nuclear ribonucleoprotein (snRNP)-like protein
MVNKFDSIEKCIQENFEGQLNYVNQYNNAILMKFSEIKESVLENYENMRTLLDNDITKFFGKCQENFEWLNYKEIERNDMLSNRTDILMTKIAENFTERFNLLNKMMGTMLSNLKSMSLQEAMNAKSMIQNLNDIMSTIEHSTISYDEGMNLLVNDVNEKNKIILDSLNVQENDLIAIGDKENQLILKIGKPL